VKSYLPNFISRGDGMWRMLQHSEAEDFVLATGETNTVRKFVELTFKELGIEIEWQGENENEKGIVKNVRGFEVLSAEFQNAQTKNQEPSTLLLQPGSVVVAVDPNYYRPTEVDLLIGDASKAKAAFGWEAKTKFDELARLMAKADFEKVLKRGF